MKKIVTIILTIITIPTYATTMCVKNDNVAVILDPSIKKINQDTDKTMSIWYTYFPYGIISGISACINK